MLRRLPPLALSVLVALSGFACNFEDTPEEGAGHQTSGESWTVLVYMVADNDLEPFALYDLQEMAQVPDNANFHFVVQADRSDGYTADGIGNLPNWTSAKRIIVHQGTYEDVGDLGEVNMGDPNVLADFVSWGMRTYPADRYALVFWDHGAAWPGFGADEANDYDHLSIAEMKQGIAQGLQQAGGNQHLALVGYDACLMSTWEVALALRPYSEYLLASEELEPGHGWDWSRFDVVANDPSQNPVALGKSLVDGFQAQAETAQTSSSITLALTDLYALDDLKAGIDALATEAQQHLDTGAVTLARAADASIGFNRTPDPSQSSNMVDIGDLAAHLAADDGRFSAAQQQIAAGLQKAVLYRTSGTVTSAATGLSIYFPTQQAHYRADYDDLEEVASWRTFLKAYYGDGTQGVTPTFINPGKVAEANISGGKLNLQGNLASGASAAIAKADLFYGFRLPDGSIAILGDQPVSYDAVSVLGSWNLSVLTLTQGSVTGYGYLSLQQSGQSNVAAVIPFAYVEPGAPAEQYAIRQLVFDANGNTVQDTWYLVTDAGVGELAPIAGSTVKPLLQTMDAQGNVTWAYGGDAMNPTQQIQLTFSNFNSGTQVYGELDISNAAGHGDIVSALATVP